jgi:hypothetical protein
MAVVTPLLHRGWWSLVSTAGCLNKAETAEAAKETAEAAKPYENKHAFLLLQCSDLHVFHNI